LALGGVFASPNTARPDANPGASVEPSREDGAIALTETRPAFPLVVEPGKRYLIDSDGKPFLVHGDTAWSLIAQLTRREIDRYLADRCARGFNAVLVHLIEARFATDAPANAYGQLPFLLPADYRAPNEGYFAHADWALRRAAERGLLVLLTPSYVGPRGDSAGWYHAMLANGPDRLRQYGEYLGRRYRDFTNIMWVHGGDYEPASKDLVRAIARGIREFDARALHTAHGADATAALDYWHGEDWLQVNTIHAALPKHWSNEPVYAAGLEQYQRPERMPFLLIEGAYENEHGTTEQHLRTQAYQSLLTGGAGQIFGNNPIWHFDGFAGPYPFFAMDDWFAAPPVTWEQALESRGAQSMTHLHNVMSGIPWWLLKPDCDNALLTDGFGPPDKRAVAALAADRSVAILYLPGSREITVDLGQLAGPRISCHWYDPADGRCFTISRSECPAKGSRQFRREVANSGFGSSDWVLILQSHA
jgi:hypothetical protein